MKNIICLLTSLVLVAPLSAQTQRGRGYPEKEPVNLFDKFKKPPKGYGNIPFYWWQGDSLSKDRLKEQLEILSEAAIDGFAVSYAHTDPRVEPERAVNGYGFAGNTEPGAPELFSEAWWDIWKWYADESAKYGIGVGLDDYTFGWPNNGYFPDQIRDLPGFSDYGGKLKIETIKVSGGEQIEKKIPDHFVTAVAWPGKMGLQEYIKSGILKWTAPAGDSCRVYLISTESGFAIHPDHGKKLVDLYFGEFDRRLTPDQFKSMNYFFQDELTYPISMLSWSDDFREEFAKRKNYDILPYLPALTDNIGPVTPKIKLDYCDVLLDLAEERYFKPIYNWHAEKGLIYGSDNHGRGKDPLAYVDYFRANGWYTAPGNDAPARGSSFIETKVSSSISHVNQRPRTWLEAFHSMGWGSTGAWLTEQIDHHFIAGGNLVCMHGLYYSTHGGWWEWAPPCFHFRMPYWPHMKKWFEYIERMSYILSQGTHVCDIAVMYPTESMQAYADANANIPFDLAMKLSEQGLDYDFIHYKSLREATVDKGNLTISDEKYKVLILADLRACHHSTLLKALEHYRKGGIVLATGSLPQATTLGGEASAEVNEILQELFGMISSSAVAGTSTSVLTNAAGGKSVYLRPGEFAGKIRELIVPDFLPAGGKGKVLHRKIGEKDVYMVTNVEKGDICFFRTLGKVELWDATTGEKEQLPVLKQDENGTYLKMNKENNQSYLLVFSPGEPQILTHENVAELVHEVPMTGDWDIEFLQTMNNKWGDFRLPASDELIGPEAPVFKYRKAGSEKDHWMQTTYKDSDWRESIYGYGIQAETCLIDSLGSFSNAARQIGSDLSLKWRPYEFSWRYGVWDNPGSQGFHGLKGRVSNGFFILNEGAHQFFRTNILIPADGMYKVVTDGRLPDLLLIDGEVALSEAKLNMSKGWHEIVIGYSSTPKVAYEKSPFDFDPRQRSMVAVYPVDAILPAKMGIYDRTVSSIWGVSNPMLYSPYPEKENNWQFRVRTVPGVKDISFYIHGTVDELWLSGKKIAKKHVALKSSENGINQYVVCLPKVRDSIETMAIAISADPGYQGAAVFSDPIKFVTAIGKLTAGNWADFGSLRYYSGGMYYRKKFVSEMKQKQKTEIDLGQVVATCEVKVNGKLAGVFMSPPYKIDITNYVSKGSNDLEILVYSTLSNHYQTIPGFYRGKPDAGLLGPVRLHVSEVKEQPID